MRIAVIATSEKRSEKLKRCAQALSRQFSVEGHVSDFFSTCDSRFSTYDFLVVCSEPSGAGSAMGKKLGEQLSQGGNLVGKRSMAILVKAGFFPRKALSNMMRILEKEGMVVTMAEIVANEADSAEAAREAPLTRG